jgi:YHS domain-containing protein
MRRNGLRCIVATAMLAASIASIASIAAEKAPLAIKGYDTVAYFTLGAPVRGLVQYEHEWDEQRYRFSRAEHRELFKADPARYAPQFANVCAMALTRGETVEANPEYWLVSNGRLYLFGKPVGPQLFQKDLEHKIERAKQNHLAGSGR